MIKNLQYGNIRIVIIFKSLPVVIATMSKLIRKNNGVIYYSTHTKSMRLRRF